MKMFKIIVVLMIGVMGAIITKADLSHINEHIREYLTHLYNIAIADMTECVLIDRRQTLVSEVPMPILLPNEAIMLEWQKAQDEQIAQLTAEIELIAKKTDKMRKEITYLLQVLEFRIAEKTVNMELIRTILNACDENIKTRYMDEFNWKILQQQSDQLFKNLNNTTDMEDAYKREEMRLKEPEYYKRNKQILTLKVEKQKNEQLKQAVQKEIQDVQKLLDDISMKQIQIQTQFAQLNEQVTQLEYDIEQNIEQQKTAVKRKSKQEHIILKQAMTRLNSDKKIHENTQKELHDRLMKMEQLERNMKQKLDLLMKTMEQYIHEDKMNKLKEEQIQLHEYLNQPQQTYSQYVEKQSEQYKYVQTQIATLAKKVETSKAYEEGMIQNIMNILEQYVVEQTEQELQDEVD